jgi:hypothetical protein
LTAALVNLLGDERDAAGLPPEPLVGWYTSGLLLVAGGLS